MSNITGSINLSKLKSALMKIKNKKGDLVECVVIPINDNYLVKGKEGGVYLNIIGYDMEQKPNRKDTHMVKQSVPKEHFEKFTDEQKKEVPILGNMILWGSANETQNNSFEADSDSEPQQDDDSLPF